MRRCIPLKFCEFGDTDFGPVTGRKLSGPTRGDLQHNFKLSNTLFHDDKVGPLGVALVYRNVYNKTEGLILDVTPFENFGVTEEDMITLTFDIDDIDKW